MQFAARSHRVLAGVRGFIAAPAGLAALGGVVGALLAGAALALDHGEHLQLTGVSTASVRTMFGALLTGAITATAVLFWIRGTLIQLAAGELSPRVVQGYLNDRFLHVAFAFLMAVFAHALVTLLWLPRSDADPVPAAASLSGAVLAALALLLIVHAVHDSVRAMNPSRVLTMVTTQTLDVIRRLRPPHGQAPSAAADPAGEGAGRVVGKVTAPRSAWITDIDYAGLAAGLPAGGVARLMVHGGDFVTSGSTLGVVSVRGDTDGWDAALVTAAFTVSDERHLENNAEYGLEALVALALSSLTSGADRATAFEALRCIGVLLDELLHRDPVPRVLAFDDERVVVRRFGRTHDDILRATLGELLNGADASPEFTRALLEDLRRLSSSLAADGLDDRAELVRAHADQLAATEAPA